VSCGGGTGTTDERRQDEESDTDGAGHCGGELRRDPSVLESWTCTVHQHRTGLIGNGRASAGSSGRRSGADDDDDDGDRHRLMQIMCISDRRARRQAILRYLAEAEAEADAAAAAGDAPDPLLATRAFHARAAATGKARSPSVVHRVDGMTSVDVESLRRRRREPTSAVKWRVTARYDGAVPLRQRYTRTHNRN